MAKRGRPRHPDILTPREWEVLALLREGLTNEQVAERLGVTVHAARYHVSEILSKLGVGTREEAAGWQAGQEPSRWSVTRIALAIGGTAVFAAAVAGLALLAWGVSESSGSPEETKADSTTAAVVTTTPRRPTATPTPPPPEAPPIERVTAFDADGTYVYDTQSGDLFRTWEIGSWMPDGRVLAYSTCCLSAGTVVALDLAQQVESTIPGLEGSGAFAAATSPDGSHFVLSRSRDKTSGMAGIYLLPSGATEAMEIVSGLWPQWSWSPDSRYLAYSTNNQTFLYDVQEERTVRLPLVGGAPMGLTWSPTANLLATATPQGLFAYDADTGETRTVIEGEVQGPPVWSPDGTQLIARYGETDVAMLFGPTEVTRHAVIDLDGSFVQLPTARRALWSPDGDAVIYLAHSMDLSEDQFHVYALATGEDRAISTIPGVQKEAMAWSPDGVTIAYASIPDAFLFDLDTGATTHLGTIPENVSHFHHLRWSPDGRYLEIILAGGHS